ncbi:MAG: hypothetical protein ROY99_02700 [Ignavibacterium sp.]|jgi:hypothetical protein|nr:hypothetical protein [Ignavibacterium sp.]
MKTLILCLSVFSLLIFYSCEDNSDLNSFPKSYKYTGYDSSWNKIIEGYLWIESIDSIEVKGGWRFRLVSNCENIGPQIGYGSFEGTTNMLGDFSLNLNPGMIDNNVLLNCSMRLPYKIDGMWSYIGFRGVINWGRFEGEQLR